MAILLQDQWFGLGCGCEASTLGGLLVSTKCRAHRVLIPEDDLRFMTAPAARYGTIYGPIDLPVHEHAKGGDARRTSRQHVARRSTAP